MFDIIHIIHLYTAFIYGGFLIVDNLFMSKMGETLSAEEATKAREAIMMHVRKVVPWSLLIAVGTGIYMFINIFGEIGADGMSSFQILLSIKAFFGLWLGFRGFNQKFFGINPWVFKSHLFPFILVLIIIFLSQAMFISF
ncbi:hypothetical protein MNB_SV-6-499 [hydrothermal vent metagenome]|uniref:Copper resistance protein D domain-containing protein n=1 Tax=hydrothermal vent metagenome TaxID=652676 RepID=A0A1W1CAD5_9ZZZZ